MTGFIVMIVMAIIAIPVAMRHSSPFSLSSIPRNLPAEPIVLRPESCVAGEDGKDLSSTTMAKVIAALMAVFLMALFSMAVGGLSMA